MGGHQNKITKYIQDKRRSAAREEKQQERRSTARWRQYKRQDI
jgi:hypothetical protein